MRRRSDRDSELRRRAEERLEASAPAPPGAGEAQRLIHELEVHQIELEMQNEELRAARQENEAGLRRYTALFDFAPIGYFVLGAAGEIHELNFAGARLLGLDRTSARGRRLDQFVATAQRPAFARFLERVLTAENGESDSCELSLIAGAITRDVQITAAAFGESSPAALLAVEDVSQRKRAEESLREESRNKDMFLAVLSHELRNPLAPIRNSLYVLARSEVGQPVRKAQEVIDRQVGHLTRLVDDLLEVTRIARGKIRVQVARVELGAIVRETIDDHRSLFEANGVTVETRVGSGPFWVDADPTRMAQVLGNLLSNAAKFTPRGGRVTISLDRQDASVALRVRDTGMGLAPESRESLFEPFVQGPQSSKRATGGLGLGLAMVKGLTELHGGTVHVHSAGPGRGAEFTVRLPLLSAPAEAPAPVPVPVESRLARPRRVLVIDDHPDSGETLKDALSLDGHRIEVATDGPSGLERAREFRPEVIICDIAMPGMDGYEVARAARADERLRDAYLVALSGYGLAEDVKRATDAGFDRHITKPPSLEDLQRLMSEVPAPRD